MSDPYLRLAKLKENSMSLFGENMRRATVSALFLVGAICASEVQAQTFYNGTINGVAVTPGTGVTGGTLAFPSLSPLPADINFGDTLGANNSGASLSVVDTFTFGFGAGQGATGGGSVTGDAIWFQGTNFSISGIITGLVLTDTTTGTVIYSSTSAPTMAASYFLGDTVSNNQYALQVSTLTPANASAASYTGVLLAQAIPEPASAGLMGAGLLMLVVGLGIARRRS